MSESFVVLVTCKSPAEARRIARVAVASRHAACANILPGKIESVYRWKGSVERARETLMLLKTTRRAFPKLRDTIRSLHSYGVPEIIALPVAAGLEKYLTWIGESVSPSIR
jgi:periplasmic divalent cation tolerance protein